MGEEAPGFELGLIRGGGESEVRYCQDEANEGARRDVTPRIRRRRRRSARQARPSGL